MKNIYLFFGIFFSFLGLANMANPMMEGSKPQNMYPLADCSVVKENIRVSIQKDKNEKEFFAKYNVTYHIFSETEKQVPLVFVGVALQSNEEVIVNGQKIQLKNITENEVDFLKRDKDHNLVISFAGKENYNVNANELMYFVAHLKKGENNIIINYNAAFSYDRRNFLRTYILEYSLYPSKFWKSFENVEFEIESEIPIEITSSSVGNPISTARGFLWKINNFDNDLTIKFTRKFNVLTKILIALEPFGIACMVSLVLVIFHLFLLKKQRKRYPQQYNWWVPLGIIFVPFIFCLIFIGAFDFLDWLTDQKTYHYLYFVLAIFTGLIFLFFYGIFVWIFDKNLKRKYR